MPDVTTQPTRARHTHTSPRQIAIAWLMLAKASSGMRSGPNSCCAELGMMMPMQASSSREQQALFSVALNSWTRYFTPPNRKQQPAGEGHDVLSSCLQIEPNIPGDSA